MVMKARREDVFVEIGSQIREIDPETKARTTRR